MKAYEIIAIAGIVITVAMIAIGISWMVYVFFKEGSWFLGMAVIGLELMMIGFFWEKIRGNDEK